MTRNIPLVLRHGTVRIIQVEGIGEVMLSAHRLRKAVGDEDGLAGLSHGGHDDVWSTEDSDKLIGAREKMVEIEAW